MKPVPAALGLFLGLCISQDISAFPEYDAPQTAVPAPRPTAGESVSCTVPLISSAALDGYGLTVSESWRGVPTECSGGRGGENWDLIVLEFNGNVAGVQFDRFGALWFAGVELLRTTTPEPATGVDAGTHWKIEKDVTDYAALFATAPGAANTTVAIPNVITSVYTGVEYVTASLTFYSDARRRRQRDAAARLPPTVLPVADPTANFMSIMALTNETIGLNHSVALPAHVAGKVKRAYLDVYSSNHGGSEEFWYLTPSAYRELNLFIDGCMAAAWYPELVVYTGGICPLLWRPLVSYLALDVPARRLDISAFAGVLNDGKQHNFEFRVVGGDPSGSSGVWYIDPVLVLELDPLADSSAPETLYSGALEVGSCKPFAANDTARSVVVRDSKIKGLSTVGSFNFTVSGSNTIKASANSSMVATTSAAPTIVSHAYLLQASNLQQSPQPNATWMPTTGDMSATVQTALLGAPATSTKTSTHETSFIELDASSEDKFSGTFLLTATMNLTRRRNEVTAGETIQWTLAQNSSGAYNRSNNNHTLVYVEANAGSEMYSLLTRTTAEENASPCFVRTVAAEAGHVTSDTTRSDGGGAHAGAVCAKIPAGRRVCGSELCGFD